MTSLSEQVMRELAPTGRLRVAINYGNAVLAQRDERTGEPRGITADLSFELARRLTVSVEFITYDGAGKIVGAAASNEWDVAFMAIDPLRAQQILFTPPYLIIEGAYLVRADAPFQRVDDLDREGVRIAVGKGAAYDLYLTRTLKHAALVRAPSTGEVLGLFVAEGLDAVAGIRQPLQAAARENPEWRVIPERFMAIEQAMCTPAGREEGGKYLAAFIAAMKASGFVADALARHGQRDVTVAP
ncbi:MAG: ABC transporter substrate-binding protein [Propionivibrio sp.]